VSEILVGDVDVLAEKGHFTVETSTGRFCVRKLNDAWIVDCRPKLTHPRG